MFVDIRVPGFKKLFRSLLTTRLYSWLRWLPKNFDTMDSNELMTCFSLHVLHTFVKDGIFQKFHTLGSSKNTSCHFGLTRENFCFRKTKIRLSLSGVFIVPNFTCRDGNIIFSWFTRASGRTLWQPGSKLDLVGRLCWAWRYLYARLSPLRILNSW